MAMPEKTPLPIAPDIRLARLAQERFFAYYFVCQQIIYAEMPAGEGVVYNIAIDIDKNRLHCTCSFQPQPCLHAVALHHFFLQSADTDFPTAEVLPDWVQELLAGNSGRLPTKALVSHSISRQQRRYERLERATDGFADLEGWLFDVIRRGVATTVSEDQGWTTGIATRAADASLTGLSRTLRLTGNIAPNRPDWAEKTLAVLAESYLAVRAFRKRETLPENQVAELQQWLGISTKKEEVLAKGEQLTDAWAVVGQVEEVTEDKLKVRRTWLLGQTSRRYALLVDYAFGGAPFAPGWLAGTIQRGTIAWYPSSWPLRALAFDDFQHLSKITRLEAYDDFQTFATDYAKAVGAQPWLSIFPAIFAEAAIFFKNEILFAVDVAGKMLPLHAAEHDIWRLLALSGGHPISVFGEWNGTTLRPLTVIAAGRLVVL